MSWCNIRSGYSISHFHSCSWPVHSMFHELDMCSMCQEECISFLRHEVCACSILCLGCALSAHHTSRIFQIRHASSVQRELYQLLVLSLFLSEKSETETTCQLLPHLSELAAKPLQSAVIGSSTVHCFLSSLTLIIPS